MDSPESEKQLPLSPSQSNVLALPRFFLLFPERLLSMYSDELSNIPEPDNRISAGTKML